VYEALGALDALTGRDTREAVLDRLFARFCIGK
jgi:tRNA U34 5-carboxymethylaminomethyl modifying GTPase MnmE/TrmE